MENQSDNLLLAVLMTLRTIFEVLDPSAAIYLINYDYVNMRKYSWFFRLLLATNLINLINFNYFKLSFICAV